jgi:hypothetical protein
VCVAAISVACISTVKTAAWPANSELQLRSHLPHCNDFPAAEHARYCGYRPHRHFGFFPPCDAARESGPADLFQSFRRRALYRGFAGWALSQGAKAEHRICAWCRGRNQCANQGRLAWDGAIEVGKPDNGYGVTVIPRGLVFEIDIDQRLPAAPAMTTIQIPHLNLTVSEAH